MSVLDVKPSSSPEVAAALTEVVSLWTWVITAPWTKMTKETFYPFPGSKAVTEFARTTFNVMDDLAFINCLLRNEPIYKLPWQQMPSVCLGKPSNDFL